MKISRFLAYLGDALALLQMLFFSLYTFLLLQFHIGNAGLNIAILVLTAVYIVFLIIKMSVLNRNNKIAKKAGKISKKSYKYAKSVLKIAAALMVVITIISNKSLGGNVWAIVSLCFMIAALIVSIVIDIALFLIKRAVRNRFAATVGKFNIGRKKLRRKDESAGSSEYDGNGESAVNAPKAANAAAAKAPETANMTAAETLEALAAAETAIMTAAETAKALPKSGGRIRHRPKRRGEGIDYETE
jgi:hypothetical protein